MAICCFSVAACGRKEQNAVSIENQQNVEGTDSAGETNTTEGMNNVTTEITAEPTEEPRSKVTPTEEPIQEATPEPTAEPSVGYEGIDMESNLLGEEWIATFVGIIEEPKRVVFSDKQVERKSSKMIAL